MGGVEHILYAYRKRYTKGWGSLSKTEPITANVLITWLADTWVLKIEECTRSDNDKCLNLQHQIYINVKILSYSLDG